MEWENMKVIANDCGFTVWKNGIIVFDCPFERVKEDPKAGFMMLEILHEIMLKQQKEDSK